VHCLRLLISNGFSWTKTFGILKISKHFMVSLLVVQCPIGFIIIQSTSLLHIYPIREFPPYPYHFPSIRFIIYWFVPSFASRDTTAGSRGRWVSSSFQNKRTFSCISCIFSCGFWFWLRLPSVFAFPHAMPFFMLHSSFAIRCGRLLQFVNYI